MKLFKLGLVLFLMATGCGADSDPELDLSNRDPRCLAVCPETMPPTEGVGAVCDAASRAQCLDQCEARIAGLPTVCQSCLLEDACFGPDGCFGDSPGSYCDQTTCTLETEFGTCSYPTSDEAARVECLKKVDPRREVACETSFEPTTDCASVCL